MRQRFSKTKRTAFALKIRLCTCNVLPVAMAKGKKRLPQHSSLTTQSSDIMGVIFFFMSFVSHYFSPWRKKFFTFILRSYWSQLPNIVFHSGLLCSAPFLGHQWILQAEAMCLQWKTEHTIAMKTTTVWVSWSTFITPEEA